MCVILNKKNPHVKMYKTSHIYEDKYDTLVSCDTNMSISFVRYILLVMSIYLTKDIDITINSVFF